MATVADQRHCKSPGETKAVSVDVQDMLESGELATGTPTIVEVSTSDLTLANKVVSTGALTINGRTAAIGQAIQFTAAAGTANTSYRIRTTFTTDATPAQTLMVSTWLDVGEN